METLFTQLSRAAEGGAFSALVAAVAWGIVSVLLSPCHLASIPLMVGVISEQSQASAKRAAWVSSVFGLGILLTLAVIGVITVALGRMAGDVGMAGKVLVILVFFGFGLHLLDVWQVPLWERGSDCAGTGTRGALVLGLVLGTALGPCTFAFMAPVLAAAFKAAANHPLFAASLLLAYGVGHTAVLVAAGASAGSAQAWLDWSETSRGLQFLKKACGVCLLCGGLYQIYIL